MYDSLFSLPVNINLLISTWKQMKKLDHWRKGYWLISKIFFYAKTKPIHLFGIRIDSISWTINNLIYKYFQLYLSLQAKQLQTDYLAD